MRGALRARPCAEPGLLRHPNSGSVPGPTRANARRINSAGVRERSGNCYCNQQGAYQDGAARANDRTIADRTPETTARQRCLRAICGIPSEPDITCQNSRDHGPWSDRAHPGQGEGAGRGWRSVNDDSHPRRGGPEGRSSHHPGPAPRPDPRLCPGEGGARAQPARRSRAGHPHRDHAEQRPRRDAPVHCRGRRRPQRPAGSRAGGGLRCHEAVDLAVDRLQRRLGNRDQVAGPPSPDGGLRSPRAGRVAARDPRAHRPAYFPRPAEERRVLRRKTFVLAEETVQDAIADMELLGHSFFLFVDGCHRRDAAVHRRTGGGTR